MLIDLRTMRRPGMGAMGAASSFFNPGAQLAARSAAAANAAPLPDNTLLSAVVPTRTNRVATASILPRLLPGTGSAILSLGTKTAPRLITSSAPSPAQVMQSSAVATATPTGTPAVPMVVTTTPTPVGIPQNQPPQPPTPTSTQLAPATVVPDSILPPGTQPPPWWNSPPAWLVQPPAQAAPVTYPGGGGGGGGGQFPMLDQGAPGSPDASAPAAAAPGEATILGFPAKTVMLVGAAAAVGYFLLRKRKVHA